MRKSIYYLLLLLFVLDLAYSFVQHYNMPLDGDVAAIVLPGDEYKKTMSDPLGFGVLRGQTYAGPNRSFAHWTVSLYYKTMPFLLQKIGSPVRSVYLSCAIAKTLIQFLLIIVIALYITVKDPKREKVILSAVLLSPFFQAAGYNSTIGIIDTSIIYTFFYALPLTLLLIFIFPFYRYYMTQQEILPRPWQKTVWMLMIVFLSFNGPLIPAIVLVGFSVFLSVDFFSHYRKGNSILYTLKNMNRITIIYFTVFICFSLYSMYVGTHNLENFTSQISLQERFQKLPEGLDFIFMSAPVFPILALIIIFNIVVIHKSGIETISIRKMFGALFGFCILYIALLPFGGYREYRPALLRNDTILPVTICFLFMFGVSCLIVLSSSMKSKGVYAFLLTTILLFLTMKDTPVSGMNWSERQAFKTMNHSPKKTVRILDSTNTILSWRPVTDSLSTRLNGKLLKYWNILPEEKLYYQRVK